MTEGREGVQRKVGCHGIWPTSEAFDLPLWALLENSFQKKKKNPPKADFSVKIF